MEKKTYPGSNYQPLFDLLNQEHGIIPLESQMADIIDVVEKMQHLKSKGPVWVRASERLPGWKGPVRWRLDGIERGMSEVYYMAHAENSATLIRYEWLDESAIPSESPAEQPVKLTQERADLIREVNGRDLNGLNEQPVDTAPEREESINEAQFIYLNTWLSDGGYSFDGEYYYNEANDFFTPTQLYQLFKQSKAANNG